MYWTQHQESRIADSLSSLSESCLSCRGLFLPFEVNRSIVLHASCFMDNAAFAAVSRTRLLVTPEKQASLEQILLGH